MTIHQSNPQRGGVDAAGPRLTPLALAGVSALLWTLALASHGTTSQIVLGSLALAVWCAAMLASLAPGSRQFGLGDLRIGSLMMAYAVVSYGIATISLNGPLQGDQLMIDRVLALEGLLVVALGFGCFTLGYRLRRGHHVRQATRRSGRRSPRPLATTVRLTFVYALGVAATGALVVVQGGYGYLGGADLTDGSTVSALVQPLTILTFLRSAAVYGLSAAWCVRRTPGAVALLVLASLAEITFGLLTGVKESFFVVVLAAGIPMLLNRQGRQFPWLRAGAAIAVFVLFVTPFVTSLRGDVREGRTRLDFRTGISVGLTSLFEEDNGSSASADDESLTQVTARVRLVDNIIVIIDQTPSLHAFRSPVDIVTAPLTGIVPRFVWPSKPLRLSGYDFYRDYYRGQGISSSAITMQGSLYMHGGIWVVALGMLVLGVGVRRVDDFVVSHARTDVAVGLLPLILFLPIVKQELEVTTLLASIPIYAITYVMAHAAITQRDPGSRPGCPEVAPTEVTVR